MIERARIIERLRAELAARPENIVAAYLFGSVARGTAKDQSDVDVAVLFAQAPPSTLAGLPVLLEADLSRALGRQVEVVVLNRASVDLVHRVLRDGVLVAERSRSLRIGFEVKARNTYWDLLPILRRYRRQQSAAQ